jgi:hypothetical protein
MKHSDFRTITGLSALAIVVGVIQPAGAASISTAANQKPVAPAIASITESEQTAKGNSGKKFANVVVAIEAPATGVTKTLVTAKGAKSCTITAPNTSCTISKISLGKTLTITAKSKTAKSGYGPKSAMATYTVGNINSVAVAPSSQSSKNAPTVSTVNASDVLQPSQPSANPSNNASSDAASAGTIEVATFNEQADPNFWTATALENASTREIVFDKGAKSGRVNAVSKGSGTATKGPKPSGTNSTGKSWTAGGLPLSATGKVFFNMSGSTYVCSGSVVKEELADRSIVLTAAHCAFNQATGQFATNWIFIPNYDTNPNPNCATNPNGCWTANSLVVRSEFTTQSTFNRTALQNDWAFAVINPITANIGSFPLDVAGLSATNRAAYAFGYPQAAPYSGSDLVYCNGDINTDANQANLTWGLACNMTGGASGGPWMSAFNTSTNSGSLSSVNSYKYNNDSTKMYGPMFNDRTTATYQAALTSTASGNINVN